MKEQLKKIIIGLSLVAVMVTIVMPCCAQKATMYMPSSLKLTVDKSVWSLPYQTPCYYDRTNYYGVFVESEKLKMKLRIIHNCDTSMTKKNIEYDTRFLTEKKKEDNAEVFWEGHFQLGVIPKYLKTYEVYAVSYGLNNMYITVSTELNEDSLLRIGQLSALKTLLNGFSVSTPQEMDSLAGFPLNTKDIDKLRLERYNYYKKRKDLQQRKNKEGEFMASMTESSIHDKDSNFDRFCMVDAENEFSFTKYYEEETILRSRSIPSELAMRVWLQQYKPCNKGLILPAIEVGWKWFSENERSKGDFPYCGYYIGHSVRKGVNPISWTNFSQKESQRVIAGFTEENGKWNYVLHEIPIKNEDYGIAKLNRVDNFGCAATGGYWLVPDTSRSIFIAGTIYTKEKYGMTMALPFDAYVFSAFNPSETPLKLSVEPFIDQYNVVYQYYNTRGQYAKSPLTYVDNVSLTLVTAFQNDIISYRTYLGQSTIDSLSRIREKFNLSHAPEFTPDQRLYLSSIISGDINQNDKMEAWIVSISNGKIINADIIEETENGIRRVVADLNWLNKITENEQVKQLMAISKIEEDLFNVNVAHRKRYEKFKPTEKTNSGFNNRNIDVEGEEPSIGPGEAPSQYETSSKNDEPVRFASEMPIYPGGDAQMIKDIHAKIIYPPFEKENNIQGVVMVEFTVEKDGSLTDLKVIRTITGSKNLDEAALNTIKKLKAFIPAKQNGNPVRLRMTVPVRFTLREDIEVKPKN